MVGTRFLDLVRRQRALPLRRQLLQRGLEVAVALAAHVRLHPRTEQALDQLRRDREVAVEVHRPEDRLERVGEDARLVTAARALLPLAEQDEVADPEATGDVGEGVHVHDRRAELRQLALGELRVGAVGHVGHDQPEHGVAEELQALVRDVESLFERERAVRQRRFAEPGVTERYAERAVERVDRGRLR